MEWERPLKSWESVIKYWSGAWSWYFKDTYQSDNHSTMMFVSCYCSWFSFRHSVHNPLHVSTNQTLVYMLHFHNITVLLRLLNIYLVTVNKLHLCIQTLPFVKWAVIWPALQSVPYSGARTGHSNKRQFLQLHKRNHLHMMSRYTSFNLSCFRVNSYIIQYFSQRHGIQVAFYLKEAGHVSLRNLIIFNSYLAAAVHGIVFSPSFV